MLAMSSVGAVILTRRSVAAVRSSQPHAGQRLQTISSSQRNLRTPAGGFDMLSEAAFEQSNHLKQGKRLKRSRQYTWVKGNGGLDESDRELLSKIYSQAEAVFEFGLGESTRLAAAANVLRYTGVDSDALYVANSRDSAPNYFKFLFADIGETRIWGNPTRFLHKQAMQYQIAPLLTELAPFDVYFVDGRYRVACVCVSFLHASKFGRLDSLVLMHDYKERKLYHAVEQIADIVERSRHGKLVVLRRSKSTTDEQIEAIWNAFYNITA